MSPELRKELIQEAVDVLFTAMMCGASLLRAAEFASTTYYPGGNLTEPRPFTGGVPRLPAKEWRPLRDRVLKRDGYVCTYCGDNSSALCADHVVPLSRGGSNGDDNLVCCCIPCNTSKRDRLLSEWRGRYQ